MIRVYRVDIYMYALILECGMLSGETANINFIVFGFNPTEDLIFDLPINANSSAIFVWTTKPLQLVQAWKLKNNGSYTDVNQNPTFLIAKFTTFKKYIRDKRTIKKTCTYWFLA